MVNFLDVTLDLNHQSHKPYQKPNSPLVYVHTQSNHPPSIIENIPKSVNRRLSELSSTEEIFNQSVGPYQKALEDSGYNFQLKYNPLKSQELEVKEKGKLFGLTPPILKMCPQILAKNFSIF